MMTTKAMLLGVLGILSLGSCCLSDEEEDRVEQALLEVEPECTLSPVWAGASYYPAFVATEKPSGESLCLGFDAVAGFHYEEGYTYLLQVTKTTLAHPLADGPDRTYVLLQVRKKEWAGYDTEGQQIVTLRLPAHYREAPDKRYGTIHVIDALIEETSETLTLFPGEIIGYTHIGDREQRLSVSITPSEGNAIAGHPFKIRLIEKL